ncbi:hypothetical protein C7B76_04200 [filamentous cyanobacterium CCP2]|nr:hypothetical protein C7B76_04200 [filamentous cyanobacterium CCP2]
MMIWLSPSRLRSLGTQYRASFAPELQQFLETVEQHGRNLEFQWQPLPNSVDTIAVDRYLQGLRLSVVAVSE